MTSIGPGLPFNAARAYGLRAPGPPAGLPANRPEIGSTSGTSRTPSPAAIRETFAPTAVSAPAAITPTHQATPAAAARLEGLVGGRVSGRVDFTGSAPTASHGDVLPLYTRAADKVEASVAVRLGSSLDVRG